jgi:hypothetical protein
MRNKAPERAGGMSDLIWPMVSTATWYGRRGKTYFAGVSVVVGDRRCGGKGGEDVLHVSASWIQ